jgi:hypothetical protein
MDKSHILYFILASTVVGPGAAQALSPRQQLQEQIAQLQRSPDDQALRENIIELTLTLNPRPSTPDTATLAEGAAEYAFKNAQSKSDYSDSAKQYEKVLLIAPWIAADYFNCCIAHEKAGEFQEAIRNFNLYVLAAPNADDLQAVKKRIGGLQYATQKAEDETNNPDAQFAKFLKGLDGGVCRCVHSDSSDNGGNHSVDWAVGNHYIAVSGNTISGYSYFVPLIGSDGMVHGNVKYVDFDPNSRPNWTATLTSRTSRRTTVNSGLTTNDEITVSDDGQSITEKATNTQPGFLQTMYRSRVFWTHGCS